MNNPGENGILRQIIKGSVGKHVNVIEILHIGDLAISPHVHHIRQLDLHDLLSLLFQIAVDHLPGHMVVVDEQNRVGIIVQPYFYACALEQVSITIDELYLAVRKLQNLEIWTINERVEFYLIFEQHELPMLIALQINSSAFDDAGSF
jgi:hypothetical protein